MTINATGVPQGLYSLTLESIDSAGDIKPEIALKTDIVTIYVTEYVRTTPVASQVIIRSGNEASLFVSHAYTTIALPTPHLINLRQKTTASLTYVAITNDATSASVVINTTST